jgi:nanoRNase/pAp phosphatase (c-di-AMP/oligoRNAs hydrolase)
MDVIFGAVAFFLNLQKDLRTGILTYTQTLMTESKDPRILAALEDLQKNGVDITQLQSFLTTTSQNLTA